MKSNLLEENAEISPLVKSLSGVIEPDADFDPQKEYADYLAKKYTDKTASELSKTDTKQQ